MKIDKVVVRSSGKRKFVVIHDQKISPPCSSEQIMKALKQQFEVLNFVVENGTVTALVGKKIDETE